MLESNVSQQIHEAVAAIRKRTDLKPRAGVVLGTGLGSLPDAFEVAAIVPYEEIPHFARSRVESHANEPWVVNVLSATKYKRIVPATIRLIQQGYPVYLTSAVVEGKEWMRLRIGFFKSRMEAETEGERIMAELDFADSWTTKVGAEELAEYGGFGSVGD